MIKLGIKRYRDENLKARKGKHESTTPPGIQFIRKSVSTVSKRIGFSMQGRGEDSGLTSDWKKSRAAKCRPPSVRKGSGKPVQSLDESHETTGSPRGHPKATRRK
mgnify:CR=1 FL=1